MPGILIQMPGVTQQSISSIMEKKKQLETKKKWETPFVKTLPFKSTLGGPRTHPYYEDGFYS